MGISYSQQTDKKWQKYWEENETYKFDPNSDKQKLYLLEMFSYPSGAALHMGHWWNYSLPDSWGRMKRMQGYNVFHPTGFDAFGLPAENYAIKTGIHPKDSTEHNIATMERQLREVGCTYDWNYEVITCKPEYYRWTQWIFLQLYKHDLAYRKNSPVNWCTGCQTVLANEQVVDGTCERCHKPVIRKNMEQWCFRTTKYADELLDGLATVNWPEKTKLIQKNWIGRSEGAEIEFEVENSDLKIKVFTTRPDTLMGLSYVVIAPEYSDINVLTTDEHRDEVAAYAAEAAKKDEIERTFTGKEKSGVFTGSYVLHPITGKRLPVYVADYVIATYGTGAVMAVPAHDERDFEFAAKYGLDIIRVINAPDGTEAPLPYCEHEGVLVNSGDFTGLDTEAGKTAIVDYLAKAGRGKLCKMYRLRDWSVSRQRYWGAPIPMIYCPHCGAVPVPEKDLPVELPYNVEFMPNGKSPLSLCDEYINTECPICHGAAKRDTDTLDTFVCSSWYMYRFFDNKNDKQAWNPELAKKMMPVDMYVGGVEHASMHLLYARFIQKAFRDMGYLTGDEPFATLRHQGIILGEDGNKMSKSAGNTVNPDDYIKKYGADVFRTYLAFGFSYTDGGPWSDKGIEAISRFFNRIVKTVESCAELSVGGAYTEDAELEYTRNYTIKCVTADTDNFQFNTSVARLMEFNTAISKYQQRTDRSKKYETEVILDFIRLIAPLAPHFAEELWQFMGKKPSVFNEKFPVFNPEKLVKNEVEIAVQINGSVRDKMMISIEMSDDEIKEQALQLEKVQIAVGDKRIVKVIVIKNRLINIVAK